MAQEKDAVKEVSVEELQTRIKQLEEQNDALTKENFQLKQSAQNAKVLLHQIVEGL